MIVFRSVWAIIKRPMARWPFLLLLSILSICGPAPAQINTPSFFCQEIFLGQLRLDLEILPNANPSFILQPGAPLRVALGIVVNAQNEIPNTTAGTYSGTDPCSLSTGTSTATFNVPIVLTIAGTGMQRTYTISVPDFAASFNLGAQRNLSLSLQGATRGPIAIFASLIEIATLGGSLILSSPPPPTPLPPSIILTLTGLAGAALLTSRRKLRALFHLKF